MSLGNELKEFLNDHDSNGFVVFSSAAPIVAKFGSGAKLEIQRLADLFSELAEFVNVLMPSFPKSNSVSTINLDQEPSKNGLLTEEFRLRFPRNRTPSRFFPFTVSGPDAQTLFALRPVHAWGDGSLYSWIESKNLDILTIGLPPYVCSVQHRAEFLNRQILPYRSEIQVTSELIVRGEREILKETLLERKRGIEVDFRPVSDALLAHGQRIANASGIVLSSMSAKAKIAVASELIKSDPLIFAQSDKRTNGD